MVCLSSAPPPAQRQWDGGGQAQRPPPLASQIASLSARVDACEARLGVDAERAAEQLCGVGKDGKVRSLERLAAEAQSGQFEVMLKEDATGTCHPVRVVDVVLLRLYSEKSGGKVLIELEKGEDGLVAETNRLPGVRRERTESASDAVKRLTADTLHIAHLSKSLNFEKTDTFTEELDSESSASMQTLTRTEIIEGYLKVVDAAARAELALDQDEGRFWAKDKSGVQRTYGWLTEPQAVEKQVKLHGGVIGLLTAPMLTPLTAVVGQGGGSLQQRATEVAKKVDAMFTRDKKMLDVERHLPVLDFWAHTEPTQALSRLRQQRARWRYIAEHEQNLGEFTRALAEVGRLTPCINPPSLQDIPACDERLQRLEARSAIAAQTASRMYDSVAKTAEQYHQAIAGIGEQLGRWDALLTPK